MIPRRKALHGYPLKHNSTLVVKYLHKKKKPNNETTTLWVKKWPTDFLKKKVFLGLRNMPAKIQKATHNTLIVLKDTQCVLVSLLIASKELRIRSPELSLSLCQMTRWSKSSSSPSQVSLRINKKILTKLFFVKQALRYVKTIRYLVNWANGDT